MSSIFAIARTLVKEVLRMRMLLFFLLIMFSGVTVFFAWWLSTGTGRPDEKIQTFLSYSTRFITALLSLLTVFVTTASVTRDIKRREIFTIATKPVSRLNYLLGKFVGVTILNVGLLAIAGGLIYFAAQTLAKTEVGGTPEEIEYSKARINSLVLTARKGVQPEKPENFEKIAEKDAKRMLDEQLKRTPQMKEDPQLVDQIYNSLYQNALSSLKKSTVTVPPGKIRVFRFKNIKVRPGDKMVYLRYKMDVSYNPDSLKMYGEWWISPGDPAKEKSIRIPTYDTIRTFHELPIPVQANGMNVVTPEGDLYVAFRNPFENIGISAIFSEGTGLEVLYTADLFETNFLRGLFLILLRLIYITILALAFASCLSFPVAVLVVLVVYMLGTASGFILSALNSEALDSIAALIRFIMIPIPRLADYDPAMFLEKGRMVSYDLISNCLLMLILIKGGILFCLGYLLFRRKELARVIV